VSVDGKRIARGRDFADNGSLRDPDLLRLDETGARGLTERLTGRPFVVRSVEEKPYLRRPAAPFTTSTLQQEASRKLRFSAQTTMRVAQRLYERGYITYMRTDSTTLSQFALDQARRQARELFGAQYVPERPRTYDRKVKNAQEAHEAIRPAGERFRRPAEVARELDKDEASLYELVWQRTIASQMADARGQTVSVRIAATSTAEEDVEFGTAGTVITFRGFMAAYEEGSDEEVVEREEEKRLPPLEEGQELEATAIEPEGHTTAAPPRYTEASLVKALEERGIGRPSTYASIIGTILDRGYVFKKGTALVPSFTAFAVVRLLEEHFGRLVDYDFTARMEDDLDRIAAGDEERISWLRRFYFGGGDDGEADEGLKHLVTTNLGEIDARAVNSIQIGDGSGITLRIGRYGPYIERGDQRASVPEDMAPDELTVEAAEQLFASSSDERTLGTHPETGRTIVARSGRYGPYVTEVLEEGADGKPKTGSLFASMSLETVTLDDAVRLLSLPRTIGADPADGEPVEALNGRYGPYIKKGSETRSLEGEEQLFTVSLDEALALLAAPKARRGQRQASAAALKELGPDPGSGKPIVVKDGRFGPYVTDGETNASLRKQDSVETVTLDRALELLAERRAKGPAKPKRRAPARRRST
jgi:DNA topoisomerase-1